MSGRLKPLIIPAVLAVVVSAWFWPATLMGRRPIGGAVTRIDLPLYTFYGRALADGRTPLWNNHWGFGSPAVGDGRIGVFYPFHQLLYRLVEPWTAYTTSLVLHTILASWLAFWCARGFGLSPTGAALAALCFAGQGFFVSHADRAWAITTGCWLPLAVLASWRWVRHGAWWWLLTLAPVLAIQLLAGHFQLAGWTIVTIMLVTAGGWLFWERSRQFARRAALLPLAVAGGLALAAVQLVPTVEQLARTDWRGHTAAYRQSHAQPPLQLVVNHVAPGAWHSRGRWEESLWAPWRTSSVECLPYVGLLPLGLAVWALVVGRREPLVRTWAVVLATSLLLCVAGAIPATGWLTRIPLVGWFSAPARWSVVAGLSWSLLAGWGIDRLPAERFSRWCGAMLAGGMATVVLGVGLWGLLPVAGIGRPAGFRTLLGELVPTAVQGAGLLLLSSSTLAARLGSRRVLVPLVLAWTALDLGLTASLLRPVDWSSESGAIPASTLLDAVGRRPPGRVAGAVGLWPMLADRSVLPVDATPDIDRYWEEWVAGSESFWSAAFWPVPVPERFGDTAIRLQSSIGFLGEDDIELMRLAGVRLIVVGFDDDETPRDLPLERVTRINDLPLARGYYGEAVARKRLPEARWTLWEPTVRIARAWLFPRSDPEEPGTNPLLVRRPPPARRGLLDRATPFSDVVDSGETVVVSGRAASPGILVLSDLEYPGWEAELRQEGEPRAVPIRSAFGAFRGVDIGQAGEFELTFRYRPRSYRVGWQISIGALAAWAVVCLLACSWWGIGRRRRPAT